MPMYAVMDTGVLQGRLQVNCPWAKVPEIVGSCTATLRIHGWSMTRMARLRKWQSCGLCRLSEMKDTPRQVHAAVGLTLPHGAERYEDEGTATPEEGTAGRKGHVRARALGAEVRR